MAATTQRAVGLCRTCTGVLAEYGGAHREEAE